MEKGAQNEKSQRSQGSLFDRLRFAGLDSTQLDFMRKHRDILLPKIEAGLRDLFVRYQSYPDAARNFESEHQIERLHDLMASHWSVLSDARFDSLYAERVKVLSDAQSKMGLDPRWHIAGHGVVLEHLIAGALAAKWPRSWFSRARKIPKDTEALLQAVVRTVMVDIEIAVSLRFNELRLQHQKALKQQREEIENEAGNVFAGVIGALAAGDLTARVPENVPEAYQQHASMLNTALERLQAGMANTVSGTEKSMALADAASLTAREAAALAGSSAERLTANVKRLEDLTEGVSRNAIKSRHAEEATNQTRKAAERSGEIVGAAINAMSDIETSAEKIGQIIGVIDEIAFQTNLLALNAGIEAARAGDSGRGFAVVAQEVRALAQRSAEAAREIKVLVTETKSQVDDGVQMVGRTQAAFADIVKQVGDINDAVTGIVNDANKHVVGLGESSAEFADIGREAAKGAEISIRAGGQADDLHTVILELGNTIRSFRIAAREPEKLALAPVIKRNRDEPGAEHGGMSEQQLGERVVASAYLAGLGG